MFDLSRKVIFTHPPRCGGTTIEGLFAWHPSIIKDDAIRNKYAIFFHKWKHADLDAHIYELISTGEDVSTYFILSCIRNPWDRAVSRYWHLKIKEAVRFKANNPDKELPDIVRAAQEYTFDRFVLWDCERVRRGGHNVLSIDNFIYGSLNVQPNLIVRYENYLTDLQVVAEKYNLDLSKMHSFNADSRPKEKHYRDYYADDLSVALVAELAQDSIKRFGYTF